MLGERFKIAAFSGVRNVASGTSPPRGEAWEVGADLKVAATDLAVGSGSRPWVEKEGCYELWTNGKQDFGVRGRALERERTAGDGEASLRVRGVPAARERISRGN